MAVLAVCVSIRMVESKDSLGESSGGNCYCSNRAGRRALLYLSIVRKTGPALSLWQEAIRFADLVYELTGDFPGEERFGLTNQMRRAAVSISSNIAETSSRASRTDFARFVEIATGSLFEVVSQTTVALRRKMIAQNDYNRIYAAAEKQSRMLSGLRRSLSER